MSDQVSDVASTSNLDDGEDSDTTMDDRLNSKSKSVHSMVEKKRRDKMTQYVTDLSTMIPMCGVMQRKLDKITVLRMAVQHLKAIKSSKVMPAGPELEGSPASVVNEGMMKAILEGADCFLFVVACDRGKFLYVSETVTNFIECQHTELIGQSIFEMLHPKDIQKVKEQLVALDVTAREVFIDAKTMEPVNPGVVPKEEMSVSSSGAARSFFCRMKNKLQPAVVVKTEPEDGNKKKRPVHVYVTLHCTGFLKTWASSKINAETGGLDLAEASCNLACLVAIARTTPRLSQNELDAVGHLNMRPVQFYARLNYEYKFCFVEPTITYVTGFLPQEVIGNSVFELFSDDDGAQLKELLRMTTKTDEKIVSPILTIQSINNTPITVRVVLSVFKNPLTSEFEHTLLDITAVASYTKSTSNSLAVAADEQEVNSQYMETNPMTHQSSTPTASESFEGDDETNAEASKAVAMSFLEADGGLGGNIDGQGLNWPFS